MTPSDFNRDELLMELVESAMSREIQPRAAFLESLKLTHPAIFPEVKDRVEWEERMAGFLSEPVIPRQRHDLAFAPGDVLGNRFRIVRELGRGGMGLVFEAMDQKLERRVALKCARIDFEGQITPEARMALEVSHPNVCKLHELHTAETVFGPVDFLTMEFIEGRTLKNRLEREGPLIPKTAREIALQLCAGLEQTHKQGIVHGDIKAANVMLSNSPEGALRAVLMDFGIAHFKLPGQQRVNGAAGGTRAYMAPELLTGAPLSVASDIYALGILFRLMLAKPGRALPKRWEKIVNRCLQPGPNLRFHSAGEVIRAIEGGRAAVKWMLAGALAVIAILAAFLWRSGQDSGPPVRLAILPVTVKGDPVPSATGLTIDLAQRLSGARRGFTVLPATDSLQNHVDSPQKAQAVLGATHVMRIDLSSSGGKVLAKASVSDVLSGHSMQDLAGEYAAADTSVLAKALIATVTGAFGLRKGVPKESVAAPAYASYVQGMALMRRDAQSGDQALSFFEKAIQLDSRSALPYAGRAEARLQKFKRGEGASLLGLASEDTAKAISINADAAPVLIAAGSVQLAQGHYEQAIARYVRATQVEPGSVEAWLRLAYAFESTSQSAQAVATYRRAIQAEPGYYRPYLNFGTFYLRRNEFQEAEALYRRTTELAPGLISGQLNLGLALMQQGKWAESEKALLLCLALNRDPRVLVNLGTLYYSQEKFEQAAKYYGESLKLGPPTALRYSDYGDSLRHLQRKHEAKQAYEAARRMAEEDLARDPRLSITRVLLGGVQAQLGDRRSAKFELNQALTLDPENAMAMHDAAIAYESMGERDRALAVLRRAPPATLEELSRHPDAKTLCQDPRFRDMIPGPSAPQ